MRAPAFGSGSRDAQDLAQVNFEIRDVDGGAGLLRRATPSRAAARGRVVFGEVAIWYDPARLTHRRQIVPYEVRPRVGATRQAPRSAP